MRSQVEVMDEGVLFVPYIDECRIESRHDLAHLSEVDVPHGEPRLTLLLVQFDKNLVFTQGDGDLGRSDVYDEFSVHLLLYRVSRTGMPGAE